MSSRSSARRSIARGTNGDGESDDRITLLRYDVNGMLIGQTDPAGTVTSSSFQQYSY